ncbi:hypothetical protein GLA29479_5036 [Lysobacter antibioticus]|nr:hypothetical protein GLA29479_5036 [Lysobacter antibioticus]
MGRGVRDAAYGIATKHGCTIVLLAVAVAVAVAVVLLLLLLLPALAVRRFALAKAIEDPEGGPHGGGPFFIGTGMSRMKNPRGCTARAGL